MKIILTQGEVNKILKEYVSKTYNVKAVDISSYEPYTMEVTPLIEVKK